MSAAKPAEDPPASTLIDQRIADLGDWRGKTLHRMRRLIHEADPQVVEEWKWRGTPVWSHDGILCTGESYKAVVKLTFAKGASLPDTAGLFNASLDGNVRRAIDIREGEEIDAAAFKALLQAARDLNTALASGKSISKGKRPVASRAPAAPAAASKTPTAPRLLSGANPQIAKADGDAPVQAYIAAMPDWKRDVGQKLDALVVRTVPEVVKAVKWNSPFYGIAGQGWFLGFHTFARYVKLTFFRGTSLEPAPQGGKAEEARWIDIREHDLDEAHGALEAQLADWIRQAAALPGWGKS